MKTINDAVKMLPPQYRSQIKELWKEADCMDLYDGELSSYLSVIAQRFSYYKTKTEMLEQSIRSAKNFINKL